MRGVSSSRLTEVRRFVLYARKQGCGKLALHEPISEEHDNERSIEDCREFDLESSVLLRGAWAGHGLATMFGSGLATQPATFSIA